MWKISLTFHWRQICPFIFYLIMYVDQPFQLRSFQLLERHCKPSWDDRHLNSKWSFSFSLTQELSFMEQLISQHNASQQTGLCPETGLLASSLLLCSNSLFCSLLSSHYTGCCYYFIDRVAPDCIFTALPTYRCCAEFNCNASSSSW